MEDSPAQHLVTTLNKDGKAHFYEPAEKPKIIPGPFGSSTHIYAASELSHDFSYNATADLDTTAVTSQTGLATMKGRIVPDNGMTAAILRLRPGAATPMHRTRTMDTGILLEGEVELHLDSGEVRFMKPGDTFVQRGTNHQWINKGDKEVKIFGVALDAKPIIDADGHELKEDGLSRPDLVSE